MAWPARPQWLTPVRLNSFMLVAAAAGLWLAGLMMVAFPSHVLQLNYGNVASEFLAEAWHPVSLLIAFLIDVGIAIGLLKDFRVRDGLASGGRLGVAFFALLAFVIAALVVPVFNNSLIISHPLIVGGCAFAALGTLRAMAYSPPQRVKRIKVKTPGAASRP